MKIRKIILLLLICSFLACDRINKEEKYSVKNLYVVPESGIKLRKDPNLSGTVIEVIPKDTMLIIFGEANDEVEIDKIKGKWFKARFYDKEGWVFSGYLSNSPSLEILKKYRIGDYSSFSKPLNIFSRPDQNSSIIFNKATHGKLLRVLPKAIVIENIPGRWSEIVQKVDKIEYRGWIFNSNLVTDEEVYNLYSPEIRKLIEFAVGRFVRPEIHSSTDNYIVISLNSTESYTCNAYGSSDCINLIFYKGNKIYTDYKKSSLGLFDRIVGDYAFFSYELGEGDNCSYFHETTTSVLNLKSLTVFRINKNLNAKCNNCNPMSDNGCLKDKWQTSESMQFFDDYGKELRKEEIPVEILQSI
ncbi:SH3 domain-containing protein (plasmid) [Leptospira interrogans serovar Canicola]|uniref:SH3 domain-containing protein n=1 Tax=Leptospira interrogans serovar Canicola TaxID=211880 RepID=A0AAQ0B014_LEPIR|nr:SH3 domain-containing protein [Leptospira interrogans]QOI44932.1 SH3 domain-containing protein [Leptospira interrogans serovar Canicola]